MKPAGQVQSGKQDPLPFSKMAGGGNDFVMIDNRAAPGSPTPNDLARRICTRALSVGADGLILIETSARATFRMRYYNSDGSLGDVLRERHPLRGPLRLPERDRRPEDDHRDGRRHRRRRDRRRGAGDAGAAAAVERSVPQRPLTVGQPDDPRQLDPGRRAALRPLPARRALVAEHRAPRPRDPAASRPAAGRRRERELRGRARRAFDRGADVRARRGGGDALLRLGRRGVVGDERAVRQGAVAGAGADAERDHVEVSFEIRDGRAEEVRLKGDARLIYRATITPETLEGFDPEFVREPSRESHGFALKQLRWLLTAAIAAYACQLAVHHATPIDRALPFVALAVTLVAALSYPSLMLAVPLLIVAEIGIPDEGMRLLAFGAVVAGVFAMGVGGRQSAVGSGTVSGVGSLLPTADRRPPTLSRPPTVFIALVAILLLRWIPLADVRLGREIVSARRRGVDRSRARSDAVRGGGGGDRGAHHAGDPVADVAAAGGGVVRGGAGEDFRDAAALADLAVDGGVGVRDALLRLERGGRARVSVLSAAARKPEVPRSRSMAQAVRANGEVTLDVPDGATSLIVSGANVARLTRGAPLGRIEPGGRMVRIGDASDWGALRREYFYGMRNPLPRDPAGQFARLRLLRLDRRRGPGAAARQGADHPGHRRRRASSRCIDPGRRIRVIIATIAALLVLPLIALRGRTLVHCYAAGLTLALFAWIVWRRLVPASDPRFAFIVLAVIELAVFALFLAQGSNVRWSANRAALIAAIVYALTISATSRKVDGDEPFYLLMTESVVHDGDLDLANQYREIAAHRVGPRGLACRIRRSGRDRTASGTRGTSRSCSLLMAPGYALGGLHGALAMIALFGVLLVRSTVRWMEDEGMPDDSVRAVFPFFAFAPPVLFYATRIWPEVPAAFFFVEAIRGVRAQRAKRWLPALLGLVMLKLRFVLVAIGLVAFGLRVRRSRWLLMLGVLAVPLLAVWMLTGSATNVHRWRELMPMHPMNYVRGFFGLLADGMSGIAFQAPFYLFGLAALLRWKEMPRGFRPGILASLLYILFLLPRQESFGGYGPPLRYLVFLMPVLALGAAAIWERIPRGAVAIAAAWTIGLVIHGVAFPWRLFHKANGENAVGEWLSQLYHSDFSRLFPSFIRLNHAAWIGAVAVALVLIWLAWQKAENPALAIAVFALLLSAGFHFGRQPGTRVDFEDAHVIHDGGHVEPKAGTPNRSAYRGGWVLQEGQSLTFLARAGTHHLHAITGLGATIELGGHAYRIEPSLAHRVLRVTIPEDGPVTLRCLSGAVNLDRMELSARAAPHPSPLPSAMKPPWGEGDWGFKSPLPAAGSSRRGEG